MADIAIAILVDDDKVLLGKRAAHKTAYPNCWDFIGGHVEAGETIMAALHREMLEEIGVQPVAPVFLESTVDHAVDAGNPPTYHLHVVPAWSGGTPRIANHEHSAIGWFTPEELRDIQPLADRAYVDISRRAVALSN